MKKTLLLLLFCLFIISCGSNRAIHGSHNNVAHNNSHHARVSKKTNHHHKTNKIDDEVPEKTTSENSKITFENSKKKDGTIEIKQDIIDFAKTFEGTRYKYGGTTKSGMDCSGLVITAFKKENIDLPRRSRDMATRGKSISLKNIEKGDLVFFKTSSKNVISHVGLVVNTERGHVRFIHSTTSAGVIISSLDEAYWKKAFVEIRRVI